VGISVGYRLIPIFEKCISWIKVYSGGFEKNPKQGKRII
jgi:hypothetical protein